ncbi:hypothetical protein J3R30DRAFT_18389 [Lentinula aciculospora]|uniref:SSCRP protein n=1 Tax=Lentinula aciculospora TaxID=153920 RepID=A0A9W9DXV5_9AGAR|nr:hypothetical protein J3R30DRAFT_18389 [Lentinula aciculospora]
MFFKVSILPLSAALLVGVLAKPVQRSSCNPNAQGVPVSIQSVGIPGLEWGIASPSDVLVIGESYRGLSAPDWYIRQSGQYPTSYFITDIDNGLAATINGGELLLNPVNNNIYQPNQVFDISCDSCGTDVSPGNVLGQGCIIGPHNFSQACISIGPSAAYALRNSGCGGEADEIYTILT